VRFFYFSKMKNVSDFLDATYLKTPQQAGISKLENDAVVEALLQNAVQYKYKCDDPPRLCVVCKTISSKKQK
jgi:deoxyribose-phosphate aldolase